MSALLSLVMILALFAALLGFVITRLLFICQPNEVLIFSGGQRASGARTVGYRIIKGGRAVRIPLFERVERMDLTNMTLEVAVRGAYSRGGIPLNVHGIANIKIAGEQPVLDNAIERFLGVPRDQIMAVAKETLEGNLRGVLATLTPEELNQDKIKFAQSLLDEAEDDLRKLGIELDTLKIQDVSDEVGYLNSIGRIQSAEVQRKAFVAEARAQAESAIREASNRQETEISRIEAEITTLRAENARRMADAQTRGLALVAEAEAKVTRLLGKAEADLEVQAARVEQVRRRLQADVLEPARARRAADEAEAKGAAAQIVEQGRANAEALDRIGATFTAVGPKARDIFLLQKVADLTRLVAGTVAELRVDRLTLIGVGQRGEGAGGDDLASRMIAGSEQIKAATGVDLVSAVRDRLAPPTTGGTAARPGTPVK